MSLIPLTRLVRRARSVAQADTDTLGAVLEAMPRGELRRLYWAAADILEADAPSETDGSVDEDWQDLDLGVHVNVAPTGDLGTRLGLLPR